MKDNKGKTNQPEVLELAESLPLGSNNQTSPRPIDQDLERSDAVEVSKKKLALFDPSFWNAKYKCILMGVIVFFSLTEIFLLNFNTYLGSEAGKETAKRLIGDLLTIFKRGVNETRLELVNDG